MTHTQSLNNYKTIEKCSTMRAQQNSQRVVKANSIIFTTEQVKEIANFETDLQEGKQEIAFEGSFLEGKAYLQGLRKIVDSVNN